MIDPKLGFELKRLHYHTAYKQEYRISSEPVGWQNAPYHNVHSLLIVLAAGFVGGKTDMGCVKVHRFG